MTGAARLASRAVRAYQACFAGRMSPCRFAPSCSNYALEALQEHGALRGLRLIACRLSRCHPWSPMRSDPVPPRARPPVPVAVGARQITLIEKFDV